MPVPYIIAMVIVVYIAFYTVQHFRNKRHLRRYIRDSFGKPPEKRRSDKLESVKKYWRACAAKFPAYRSVDENTWYDLEMDLFFDAINTTWSSVGSEVLYARLHRTDAPELEPLIQAFFEDEALRTEVAYCLHDIGKENHHRVDEFLFDPDAQKPVGYYPAQSLVPLIGMVLAIFQPAAGMIVVSLGIAWNLYTRHKYRFQVEGGIEAVRYASRAISIGKNIESLLMPTFPEETLQLKEALEPLKAVPSKMPLKMSSGDPIQMLLEYLNYALLLDFNRYNRALSYLIAAPDALQKVWEAIGHVEIALAVASLEKRTDVCIPVFHDEYSIVAQDLVHPLVKDAVPNPVDFSISTIVSGSNASGKSTYVKAIAISAITSQSLGRAFAKSFSMKRGQVLTSMAIRDNIYKGDSYFVAEIKSLKRLIDASSRGGVAYLFIDEILKGTNTVERIAASHALLRWFEQQGSLVISATHDIELTELLADRMKNIHFRETVTQERITFDYQVKSGPTRTTNAINLLRHYEFPPAITERAQALAERFLLHRSWSDEDAKSDFS